MNKLTLPTTQGVINIEHWEHLKNLIVLYSSLREGVNSYFKRTNLQYVDVPAIVGITGACENVDTLFKVKSRVNLPLFFTQTGQLSLEQALQKFSGVCTTIYSARDEEEEDERHLRQFRLSEEEFSWSTISKSKKYDEEKMFKHLLIHIEKAVKTALREIIKDNAFLLRSVYKRNVAQLRKILRTPFTRISYDEAIELLRKNGYPNLIWGDDLKAVHEQKVVELLAEKRKNKLALPTFITRYPKNIKFFNMKVSSSDPRVVLSTDLILPISGESVGSAVREHDGEKLRERLLTSTMFRLHKERGGTYDDFTWYTEDIVAAGKTEPHAGYGLGNERLMQFIIGTTDIRLASVLSLMAKEARDWDEREI